MYKILPKFQITSNYILMLTAELYTNWLTKSYSHVICSIIQTDLPKWCKSTFSYVCDTKLYSRVVSLYTNWLTKLYSPVICSIIQIDLPKWCKSTFSYICDAGITAPTFNLFSILICYKYNGHNAIDNIMHVGLWLHIRLTECRVF